MPGQAWQTSVLGNRRPAMRANNGVVLAHAIRAGNGVGVLPCFLGDGDPAMVRVTPVIRAAATEPWLLVHGDLRNVPRVRIVMDVLVRSEERREGGGGVSTS